MSYYYQLLGSTPARFVSFIFILMGMSEFIERGREYEAADGVDTYPVSKLFNLRTDRIRDEEIQQIYKYMLVFGTVYLRMGPLRESFKTDLITVVYLVKNTIKY